MDLYLNPLVLHANEKCEERIFKEKRVFHGERIVTLELNHIMWLNDKRFKKYFRMNRIQFIEIHNKERNEIKSLLGKQLSMFILS